jgi:DNA-binding NtrC family response regulator
MSSILLVDDNEIILELYKEMLEDAGYTVYTALTPYQALQIIQKQDIQLAVLDYNLPQMTGTELGHLIYKANSDVDIVFASGNLDIREIVSKVSYPVCNVFSKPIDLGMLVENVNGILGGGCKSNEPRVEQVKKSTQFVKLVKNITSTVSIFTQTSASYSVFH